MVGGLKTVNILIVDEETLFRSGMHHLLASLEPKPIVMEADGLGEARRALSTGVVDLVLIDVRVGGGARLETLACLRDAFPTVPMVVLSAERDPTVIHRCIEHGAMGFITKHASHGELLAAVRLIVAGGVYLPREATTPAPGERHPADSAVLAQLSARQREVMRYLLQGKPTKTISNEMDISQNTVKSHLSAIYRALGASNRTEAVCVATRAGLSAESIGRSAALH